MLSKIDWGFPLATKHVGNGEACILKNRSHDRGSLEREEKLDSFDRQFIGKNIGNSGVIQFSVVIRLPIGGEYL